MKRIKLVKFHIQDRVERGWCQGHMAIDRYGRGVSSKSHTAVSWCVIGAAHCLDYEKAKVFFETCREIIRTTRGEDCIYISDWQDYKRRTKQEVLSVMYQAETIIYGD